MSKLRLERGFVHCPQCGYDLRGQVEQRCPECGLHYDEPALLAMRRLTVHDSFVSVLNVVWLLSWMSCVLAAGILGGAQLSLGGMNRGAMYLTFLILLARPRIYDRLEWYIYAPLSNGAAKPYPDALDWFSPSLSELLTSIGLCILLLIGFSTMPGTLLIAVGLGALIIGAAYTWQVWEMQDDLRIVNEHVDDASVRRGRFIRARRVCLYLNAINVLLWAVLCGVG